MSTPVMRHEFRNCILVSIRIDLFASTAFRRIMRRVLLKKFCVGMQGNCDSQTAGSPELTLEAILCNVGRQAGRDRETSPPPFE